MCAKCLCNRSVGRTFEVVRTKYICNEFHYIAKKVVRPKRDQPGLAPTPMCEVIILGSSIQLFQIASLAAESTGGNLRF